MYNDVERALAGVSGGVHGGTSNGRGAGSEGRSGRWVTDWQTCSGAVVRYGWIEGYHRAPCVVGVSDHNVRRARDDRFLCIADCDGKAARAGVAGAIGRAALDWR